MDISSFPTVKRGKSASWIMASTIGSGRAAAGRSIARDASTPERSAARAGDLASASVTRSVIGGAGGAGGACARAPEASARPSRPNKFGKTTCRMRLLHGPGLHRAKAAPARHTAPWGASNQEDGEQGVERDGPPWLEADEDPAEDDLRAREAGLIRREDVHGGRSRSHRGLPLRQGRRGL